MIRGFRRGSVTIRIAVAMGVYGCALFGVFTLTGHARQARTVADAAYTTAQARRGQQLYQTTCLVCHGDALQGTVGPMLTGTGFTSVWSGRPLVELVDKIHNTMPVQAPGSLTRPQAIDLAAYMLEVGKFPAGQTEMADNALAQITFPGTRPVAAAAAGAGAVPFETAGNLAQVMRGITFPSANIIFNTQVKDPSEDKPPAPIPFDYLKWGYTIYYGWQSVDQAAISLVESTPLLMLPGRRCENGRPVPVDRADYKRFTEELITLAKTIQKTAQTRNQDAVAGLSEQLSDACANCHKVYRDGAAEGQSAGASRCM